MVNFLNRNKNRPVLIFNAGFFVFVLNLGRWYGSLGGLAGFSIKIFKSGYENRINIYHYVHRAKNKIMIFICDSIEQ